MPDPKNQNTGAQFEEEIEGIYNPDAEPVGDHDESDDEEDEAE